MEHLEYDKFVATLGKLEVVLVEQGFPKGSVTIGFNPKTMDTKLSSLAAAPKMVDSPIKTAKFECHFGGCGMICCTF